MEQHAEVLDQPEHLTWKDLEEADRPAAAPRPTPTPAAAPSFDPVAGAKLVKEILAELNQLVPQIIASKAADRAAAAGEKPAQPEKDPPAAIAPPGRAAYQHVEALVEYLSEQAPALRYDQLVALAKQGLDLAGAFLPAGKPIGPSLLGTVQGFQPQIEAYLAAVPELQDPLPS